TSMLGDQLVHKNVAVVMHDLPRDGAVVVFVTDTPAPTRVKQIVDDESFIIMVVVALSANDLSARRLMTVKTRNGGRSHWVPSLLLVPPICSRRFGNQ